MIFFGKEKRQPEMYESVFAGYIQLVNNQIRCFKREMASILDK